MTTPSARLTWQGAGQAPLVVITIAGFDPSSGAGVSADLQVFSAHGLYGTAAITALTVQSTRGVFRSEAVNPDLLSETLEKLAEDLPPVAIKLGMLQNAEIVATVSHYLRQFRVRPLVVLDPVILSSSGAELLSHTGTQRLVHELLPLTDWLTPNRSELDKLAEVIVDSGARHQLDALDSLGRAFPGLYIVQTGGDDVDPTDTLRLPSGERMEFAGRHIETTSTHGTGCVFSSALAAALVQGIAPAAAVKHAKDFVREAIFYAPGVGSGRGPLRLSPMANAGAAHDTMQGGFRTNSPARLKQ